MEASSDLKPTPGSFVVNGKVVDYGFFQSPFTNMNILDTQIYSNPLKNIFSKHRIKEWQHIALISEDFNMGFVILTAHYMSTSFCYFNDRKKALFFEHHKEAPLGKARLSRELWDDYCVWSGNSYFMEFHNNLNHNKHQVKIDIKKTKDKPSVYAEIEMLEALDSLQPLIVANPIEDNRPLFTHKAPCPAKGIVKIDDTPYTLDPSKDIAILDVQKTFYPFNTFWKWATFAGYNENGQLLGVNLVSNMIKQGDVYNENAMWANGELSRFGDVQFFYDENKIMEPWEIKTTCGKCHLTFYPQGKRSGKINLGIIMSDYHQPFGLFKGVITDKHNVTYQVDNLFGVTEHHLARF